MLSESQDTTYAKALVAYHEGRKVMDAIDDLYDVPEAVTDGAVEGMIKGEHALAEARCSTDEEMEAKLVFLFREYRLDHVGLELLHVALDAFEKHTAN